MIGLIYLAGFGLFTTLAARAAGRRLWLLDRDQAGPAWGFRVSFALLALWPLAGQLAVPGLLRGVGLGLALLGAGVALWAQAWMGRSWRIGSAGGELGALVTTGPFAWSRNPTFLGQGLLFAGLALTGAVALWPALALLLWSIHRQVQGEEAVLASSPAWRAWAARMPRWLGWPGP